MFCLPLSDLYNAHFLPSNLGEYYTQEIITVIDFHYNKILKNEEAYYTSVHTMHNQLRYVKQDKVFLCVLYVDAYWV